jgi:hypothetical protein
VREVVREQVDVDFIHARRRAFVRRIGTRLRGDPSSGAPSFEETRKILGTRNKIRLGRSVVAVEMWVGSVGRSMDFNETFLPVRRSLAGRWKRVDRAFHLGVELPPVELYKLGNRYFVLDGNHHVSVARYQGVQWIEAEVTRFYAHAPAVGTGRAGAGKRPEKVPLPAVA